MVSFPLKLLKTQCTREYFCELTSLGQRNIFSSLPWTYKAGCIQALLPLPRRGCISTVEYYNLYMVDTLSASVTLDEVVTLELNGPDSINKPNNPNNCKSTPVASFFFCLLTITRLDKFSFQFHLKKYIESLTDYRLSNHTCTWWC